MSAHKTPEANAPSAPDVTVRRLRPGDEHAFITCAAIDHEFEHDPETIEPATPPTIEQARSFLADPAVRFWLAEADGHPVGQLHGCVIALGTGASEMLLYSLGTRIGWRRHGVATALVEAMTDLMRDEALDEVWVPSALTAVAFYEACGFEADEGVVMTRSVARAPGR